jgi:ubiquinone/menaquinone biosynthesis C-methylase UbiE
MKKNKKNRVCPAEKAGEFDNRLRRLVQNPAKILGPFIKNGMTVLDLGCGPGFFTIEIARLLNSTGKVIAADLQDEMLNILQKKINGSSLQSVIELHKCQTESTGINENVDFILAFYVIHEIPDHPGLFRELKSLLKPDGKILIVEPSTHVNKTDFCNMILMAESAGFKAVNAKKMFFSRTVILV